MIADTDEEQLKPATEADAGTGDLSREKLFVDIWKQAIDTQKHFNDMCVKSRQLGLTFVAASLGAAFYLFIRSAGEGDAAAATRSISTFSFAICNRTIVLHVSLAIIAAAWAAVMAVKYLDLGVYHQMLRGAVTFNEDLEEKHIKKLIGLQKGMTQAISHFSRHSDASKVTGPDGFYSYLGENKKDAGKKLASFYRIIFIILALFAAMVFVATNFLKAGQ